MIVRPKPAICGTNRGLKSQIFCVRNFIVEAISGNSNQKVRLGMYCKAPCRQVKTHHPGNSQDQAISMCHIAFLIYFRFSRFTASGVQFYHAYICLPARVLARQHSEFELSFESLQVQFATTSNKDGRILQHSGLKQTKATDA